MRKHEIVILRGNMEEGVIRLCPNRPVYPSVVRPVASRDGNHTVYAEGAAAREVDPTLDEVCGAGGQDHHRHRGCETPQDRYDDTPRDSDIPYFSEYQS